MFKDYEITVTVEATVTAEIMIDVAASSLEEARRMAMEIVQDNVSFVAHQSFDMAMVDQEIVSITAEEEKEDETNLGS